MCASIIWNIIGEVCAHGTRVRPLQLRRANALYVPSGPRDDEGLALTIGLVLAVAGSAALATERPRD